MSQNNKVLVTNIYNLYNNFITEHGHEPFYVECNVKFKDDDSVEEGVIISFKDFNEDTDEYIFYYCQDINDLVDLTSEENMGDFYVTDVIEFLNSI